MLKKLSGNIYVWESSKIIRLTCCIDANREGQPPEYLDSVITRNEYLEEDRWRDHVSEWEWKDFYSEEFDLKTKNDDLFFFKILSIKDIIEEWEGDINQLEEQKRTINDLQDRVNHYEGYAKLF